MSKNLVSVLLVAVAFIFIIGCGGSAGTGSVDHRASVKDLIKGHEAKTGELLKHDNKNLEVKGFFDGSWAGSTSDTDLLLRAEGSKPDADAWVTCSVKKEDAEKAKTLIKDKDKVYEYTVVGKFRLNAAGRVSSNGPLIVGNLENCKILSATEFK